MKKKHLEKLLKFSLKLSDQCSEISMKYYKKTIKPKYKADNSPVTIADKKCEEFLINKISDKFPKHIFLAEESGKTGSDSDFKWIIDPIDGTKNFMRNFPFWGTLIALEHEGEVVLGIISLPAMGKIYYAAKGLGCYENKKRVKVSKINDLKNSYCIFGGLDYILKKDYKDNFMSLVEKCYYDRGYGDCFGHTLVIKGRSEFMIDPFVSPYDVAPIKICIEEAGGLFTDINGDKSIYTGSALTSNGILHDEVLKMLNKK